MAQIAKPGTERALGTSKETTERLAEQGRRRAGQVGEVAREVTDRGQDATRQNLQGVQRAAGAAGEIQREVAHRSAEETAALGRALVDLTVAQTRQNLETLSKLTNTVDWDQVAEAVDWDRVFQIQSGYLRASLGRAAELTRRYLEFSQTVLTATASATQRQAGKAA
jgi:hypothetical protein